MLENSTEIDDQIFLNSESFNFDVYFNKDPIINLIYDNISPRLSFIAYNTQKLFKNPRISELSMIENCEEKIFLTINVLSASLSNDLPSMTDLINIIFAKQQVIKKIK